MALPREKNLSGLETTQTETPEIVPDDDAAIDAEMSSVFDAAYADGDEAGEGATTQPRGEDGRFVGKDGDAGGKPDQDELTAEAEGEAEDGGEEGPAPEDEQAETVAAPAHLPQAIKDGWAKIPASTQAALVAHQTDMDRKFGEIGRQFADVKPIAERLRQATEAYPQFKGMTPERLADGVVQLAAVQSKLESDPAGTILEIAQMYGVGETLRQAFSGNAPDAGQSAMAQMQQEMAQLRRQLADRGREPDIDGILAAKIEEREIFQTIEKFGAEKPHFKTVEESLPVFVQAERQRRPDATFSEVLEAAYNAATYANPEVRAKILAEEAKKATEAADKTPERSEKAKAAKKINVKPLASSEPVKLTEDEAYSAAYDRIVAAA